MDTREVLATASRHMRALEGHVLDVLTIEPPVSPAYAVHLAKTVSKLSPILGNLIEFYLVEFLDEVDEFRGIGHWKRQDPGFPDAVFVGNVTPVPGFEVKAWFPLATEITARFKDSQDHFTEDQTDVVLLAWLPEKLIYGKPAVYDLCIVSGASVAKARDDHYHNPPDYLVVEPEDTSGRTSNLQQTNTNGYKFQGTREQFAEAQRLLATWDWDPRTYSTSPDYQVRVRELMSRYSYRLDTNYAKTDRIVHADIEAFKRRVLLSEVYGRSVQRWADLFSGGTEADIEGALREDVDIEWRVVDTEPSPAEVGSAE